ncbi:hypothetical protein KAR34_07540 [bacterium]|nr:hypothetical protein [bacterium]
MIYYPVLRHLRIAAGVVFIVILLSPGGYSFVWQGLEIIPRASLREGYDDNVTYVRNNPIRDMVTNVLAGIIIKQEGKTHSWSMDVDVAYQFFVDHASFNNISEYTNVHLKKKFSKYDQITLNNSFSHFEEPNSFEDAFGRTSGRYSTYHNYFNVAYRHDLNQQLAWNFRYNNDFCTYSREELSDSNLNTVGTGVAYTINSATILSAAYDYIQRDFSPGPSAKKNEVTVKVRRFLTTQLYFDLKTGVDFIDSYNDQRFIHPLYQAALIDDIDKTTQGQIVLKKEYLTTAYLQDLLDRWQVSLKLAKKLTTRFQALVVAFYGRGTYVSTNVQDILSGVNVRGRYDLSKKTKLSLNYVYSKNESSQETNGYIKNVVYLGIMGEF